MRRLHDAAQAKLSLAREPMPTPDSLIQARRRVERARQASRTTLEAMRAAAAHRDTILAAKPKGIRAVMAWIAGKARQHRREAVEAVQAIQRARDRHEAAERLAEAFQAALEAETEQAARDRVQAVARRRQLAEVAEHEQAVAMQAAMLLRGDPALAALPVRDLLFRADEVVRRQAIAEPGRHPSPAPRR